MYYMLPFCPGKRTGYLVISYINVRFAVFNTETLAKPSR